MMTILFDSTVDSLDMLCTNYQILDYATTLKDHYNKTAHMSPAAKKKKWSAIQTNIVKSFHEQDGQ